MAEDNAKQEAAEAPKTGAENTGKTTRDRTSEVPADAPRAQNEDLAKKVDAANNTANQTISEGNENEVQGRLAVPFVKVQKRGFTKWTDKETGEFHKELNDAEPNAEIGEEEEPDYIKLHNEVLGGADPIRATLGYQNREEKPFQEGALENAETHPRTGGLGVATRVEKDNG